MQIRYSLAIASVLVFGAAVATRGQIPLPSPPPITRPAPQQPPAEWPPLLNSDDRSGPRVGAAYIIGGSVTAERAGRSVSPLVSLFGWQFEHHFDTGRPHAAVPMTEVVLLAGGMEQGVVLPSASWLLALRQPNGWEAALGPTVTGAGIQIAFAAGVTRTFGKLNLPVNIAIVPGRRGASISVTSGFNTKRSG